ncbi:type II toxin-antitoxin system HicA family toxin [Candidatus Poriferisodalis sp.]|uniref:type II toxin-antitoxin system HicA family toxin n=1 Tax=Candidatus Poriferisodalis sp. TaxID=3101277 RepID=UPI003B018DBE
MTDQEFLRRLRRYARRRGLQVEYLPDRGKGSHAMIRLGVRTTSVPRGELGPGLLRTMLRDLDIDKKEF